MIKHILILIWNKKRSNFLLFLEILLSFFILFAVFTLITERMRNYNTPLGFDTENVWMGYMNLWEEDSIDMVQMKQSLKRELLSFSEVESVAFGNSITPFSGSMSTSTNDDNGFEWSSRIFHAGEDFKKTMGLNVIEGRWFNENDKNEKYKPVVITKKVRDLYFKDRLYMDSLFIFSDKENRIIGVIDNYKYEGEFEDEYQATFFHAPITSDRTAMMYMRVKENSGPVLEEKINKLMNQVTKKNDCVIQYLEKNRIESSKSYWIPITALLIICGFLVFNVALGLFGVLWYNISKRKAEIGLRRTIGATQGEISRQFIGEILMITLFGILVGLFFAIQFPLMQLFEIENINYYYAMAIAAFIIFILVLVCTFYPSRQAAVIHPALALHED